MSHNLLQNDDGVFMGYYVRGTGRVQSVWHQSWTGVPVIDAETITPEMVPSYMLGDVRIVAPVDPESFDPVEGLGLIKLAGVSKRLGHAGGRKRVSWTPCQPSDVYSVIDRFRDAGATVEGLMWLEPGRFLVEGTLPNPCEDKFGPDAHDVRFTAIANYTGAGSDAIIISMTRVVCANTEHVAMVSAKASGNIFKIRHSKNVADRWDVDVPAFMALYSGKIREHAESKATLAATPLGSDADAIVRERDRYFSAFVLDGSPEPEEGKALTLYTRKLEALKRAWHAERENARTVGIDPDSRRIAYEAVTNVLSHGGIVTTDDGEDWRPVLNSARTDAGRAFNLIASDASSRALALALA